MRGDVVVGKNEPFKFSVIEDYRAGKISQRESSLIVGKSERTVDRSSLKCEKPQLRPPIERGPRFLLPSSRKTYAVFVGQEALSSHFL